LFDKNSHGEKIRISAAAEYQQDETGDYEITFNGDFQFLSNIAMVEKPDPSAMINTEVMVYYNSKEDHLLTTVYASITKMGVICASGKILVETKPGYWRVWVGDEPWQDRVKVTPNCVGFGGNGWIKSDQQNIDLALAISFGLQGNVGFDAGVFGVNVNFAVYGDAGVIAGIQYKPKLAIQRAGIFVDVFGDVNVCYHADFAFVHIGGCVNLVSVYLHGELVMIFDASPIKLEGKINGNISVLSMFDCKFNASVSVDL
jgi:hypothetical protein